MLSVLLDENLSAETARQVRALVQLYDAEKEAEWKNRLFFLPPTR